jgi:hypothetical protein
MVLNLAKTAMETITSQLKAAHAVSFSPDGGTINGCYFIAINAHMITKSGSLICYYHHSYLKMLVGKIDNRLLPIVQLKGKRTASRILSAFKHCMLGPWELRKHWQPNCRSLSEGFYYNPHTAMMISP